MARLWDAQISQRTISRALQKIGHTRKKKTYGYCQRDEACAGEVPSATGGLQSTSLGLCR
jgi:hypothetical protein